MKKKKSEFNILKIVLLVLLVAGVTYFQKNQKEEPSKQEVKAKSEQILQRQNQSPPEMQNSGTKTTSIADIEELTHEKVVVDYLKKHQKLPPYYLTKNEARKKGWEAHKGNLCDVLPGKAIGGDRFGNREGRLPNEKNRQYYEADINYNCGTRNADRLVYSNDGLIYITKDHYQTFQKQ